MAAKAIRGKTESKTVRRFVMARDFTAICFCLENSLAHTAKARRSVPETRNFAMPVMNSSNMLEMVPLKSEISLCPRTWSTPQTTDTRKAHKTSDEANRARLQL